MLQVMFVAPASSRAEALELAQKAPALRVRPRVVERWARFLTRPDIAERWRAARGGRPVVLNEPLLYQLGTTGQEFVVPPALLQRALHATNMDQANIVLDAFNRERQGYAAARTGHADDPANDPQAPNAVIDLELPEWRVSDDVGRGEGHDTVTLVLAHTRALLHDQSLVARPCCTTLLHDLVARPCCTTLLHDLVAQPEPCCTT